jgi:hypothetical protein
MNEGMRLFRSTSNAVKVIGWTSELVDAAGPSAVRSNRFRFDSIFDHKVAETFWFDLIWIHYRFNSKNDSIRYKTSSAFMKENQQSRKWPILKRIVHYEGLNIWRSPFFCFLFSCFLFWFCFVNFSFFLSQFKVFLVQVFVNIESNHIEYWKSHLIWFRYDPVRFDLSKNIRFEKDKRFYFDLIWQPWQDRSILRIFLPELSQK